MTDVDASNVAIQSETLTAIVYPLPAKVTSLTLTYVSADPTAVLLIEV